MKFEETPIPGAFVINHEPFGDDRGFFARSFCQKEFRNRGIEFNPVQANTGYSKNRGTLRGMHYQTGKHAESKFIRCIRGAVYDVIIDLREESETYMNWFGVELTAENRTMFFLPEGCAHGYQTLADDTEVFYMVSSFYEPGAEKGIRWNDPAFNIEWKQTEELIISEKDRSWPDFKRV